MGGTLVQSFEVRSSPKGFEGEYSKGSRPPTRGHSMTMSRAGETHIAEFAVGTFCPIWSLLCGILLV